MNKWSYSAQDETWQLTPSHPGPGQALLQPLFTFLEPPSQTSSITNILLSH
jgi:hypothetical protein